jgi:putative phosphoribosyl transferase
MLFQDRFEGGRVLASRLAPYSGLRDLLVLGLPRGGVPVAFEIARALAAPLDVFVVRALGGSGEEPPHGAIASGGVQVLDEDRIRALGLIDGALSLVGAKEWRELERRERVYRGMRSPPVFRGRTVIAVDDGLSSTPILRAAVRALRQQGAARVVVALPVAAPELCRELGTEADEVVCAVTPAKFYAVGLWYREFKPVSNEDVRELLIQAAREREGLSFPAGVAPPPLRASSVA